MTTWLSIVEDPDGPKYITNMLADDLMAQPPLATVLQPCSVDTSTLNTTSIEELTSTDNDLTWSGLSKGTQDYVRRLLKEVQLAYDTSKKTGNALIEAVRSSYPKYKDDNTWRRNISTLRFLPRISDLGAALAASCLVMFGPDWQNLITGPLAYKTNSQDDWLDIYAGNPFRCSFGLDCSQCGCLYSLVLDDHCLLPRQRHHKDKPAVWLENW